MFFQGPSVTCGQVYLGPEKMQGSWEEASINNFKVTLYPKLVNISIHCMAECHSVVMYCLPF